MSPLSWLPSRIILYHSRVVPPDLPLPSFSLSSTNIPVGAIIHSMASDALTGRWNICEACPFSAGTTDDREMTMIMMMNELLMTTLTLKGSINGETCRRSSTREKASFPNAYIFRYVGKKERQRERERERERDERIWTNHCCRGAMAIAVLLYRYQRSLQPRYTCITYSRPSLV